MIALIRRIFTRSYPKSYERQRAYLILAAVLLQVLFVSLQIFLVPRLTDPVSGDFVPIVTYAANHPEVYALYLVPFYILSIIGLVAVFGGRYRAGGVAAVAMWFIFTLWLDTLLFDGIFNSVSIAKAMSWLMLFGFIFGARGAAVGTIVTLGAILIGAASAETFSEVSILFLVFTAVGILLYAFNRLIDIQRDAGEDVAQSRQDRVVTLTERLTKNDIRIIENQGWQEFLLPWLSQFLQYYPVYYHAQVFLVDRLGGQVRLIASTGEAGRTMLANGHQLGIGSFSTVGQAAQLGEVVVSAVGNATTTHRENPLLIDTRTEIAFPIISDNEVIGIFDVQSRESHTLRPEEESAFQIYCVNLALLISQTQEINLRSDRIIRMELELRDAVRELQMEKSRNQRAALEGWANYVDNDYFITSFDMNYITGGRGYETIPSDRWTATLAQAAQNNQTIRRENMIAVPLMVAGEVVGAMEFTVGDDDMSDETARLVENVSTAFGQAAQILQQLDESRRLARREALVNSVSQDIQLYDNVSTAMHDVVHKIQETLQAGRVSLRLGSPELLGSAGASRHLSDIGQRSQLSSSTSLRDLAALPASDDGGSSKRSSDELNTTRIPRVTGMLRQQTDNTDGDGATDHNGSAAQDGNTGRSREPYLNGHGAGSAASNRNGTSATASHDEWPPYDSDNDSDHSEESW